MCSDGNLTKWLMLTLCRINNGGKICDPCVKGLLYDEDVRSNVIVECWWFRINYIKLKW